MDGSDDSPALNPESSETVAAQRPRSRADALKKLKRLQRQRAKEAAKELVDEYDRLIDLAARKDDSSLPAAFQMTPEEKASRRERLVNKGGRPAGVPIDGDALNKARVDKGMTQEQLAEAVGVDPRTIARFEGGKNASDDEVLDAIATQLGVSSKSLIKH